MESEKIEEQIDSKYLIEEKIGTGYSANAFLVKEKESNKEYVAKVFKENNTTLFDNEVNMLNTLKGHNNPYIVNILTSGEGEVIRKERKTRKCQYYILEYAKYGTIIDYLICKQSGLGELYSKVIFQKIMKGIQICHEHNICHRDIKLENILVTEDFTPKICDFGFACVNSSELEDDLGTPGYKSPEIGRKKYDGKKVDIFALGASLIILVTGIPGFQLADRNDSKFKEISRKFYDTYWRIYESQLKGLKLSKDFKDLFINVVAYSPNKRLDAEKILDHPWFKELDEIYKDEEKKKKLEEEIQNVFLESEKDVKEFCKKEMESKNKESEMASYNTRSGGDDENKFFGEEIKPKYDNSQLKRKNIIKIKGYLNPPQFMNSLCRAIMKKYDENVFIEADKEKLKFIATFEEEEKKDEKTLEFIEEMKKLGLEEVENNNEQNALTVKIKLYQIDDGYLLKFVQNEGDRKSFFDKFAELSKLIENIIS